MSEPSVSAIQKEEDKKSFWALDKEAWKKRFEIVTKLYSVKEGLDRPLPPWTDADVEEFASNDSVYGPQVKLARQGAQIAATGGIVGGLSLALLSYGYSRSITGATICLVFGAATSWAVSEQAADVYLGLHNFSTVDANLKFLKWWKEKNNA